MNSSSPGVSGTPFSPADYWEKRLSEGWTIENVGLRGHGNRFNEMLYRLRGEMFLDELARLPLEIDGASVLDLGSGTGFYIDLWRQAGVGSVTGSDLTSAAVSNLKAAHPSVSFRQLDIGAELPADLPTGVFDVVSIFDVFFHIVDDEHFEKAISNIASLLKPGGWLLCSDALVTVAGPGLYARRNPSPHVRWRRLDAVVELTAKHGLEVRRVRPIFVLLNPPVDSNSSALNATWTAISRVASTNRAAGGLLAAGIYPLERELVRRVRPGPSTKMLALQKKG